LQEDSEVGEKVIDKCCNDCTLGYTPGEKIKNYVKSRFLSSSNRPNHFYPPNNIVLDFTTIDITRIRSKNQNSDNSKLTDVSTGSTGGGIFQFANKDKYHCAIKLVSIFSAADDPAHGLTSQNHHRTDICESLWEIPRPSYSLLPPGTIYSSVIDSSSPVTYFELYILLNKSTKISGGKNQPAHLYTEDNRSIPAFNHFIAYRINFNPAAASSVGGASDVAIEYSGEGVIQVVYPPSVDAVSPSSFSSLLGGVSSKGPPQSSVFVNEIVASFVSNSGGTGR
jgi:hypothetical protein